MHTQLIGPFFIEINKKHYCKQNSGNNHRDYFLTTTTSTEQTQSSLIAKLII